MSPDFLTWPERFLRQNIDKGVSICVHVVHSGTPKPWHQWDRRKCAYYLVRCPYCMQELFFGKETVSLLERCPHFRGVLRRIYHCVCVIQTEGHPVAACRRTRTRTPGNGGMDQQQNGHRLHGVLCHLHPQNQKGLNFTNSHFSQDFFFTLPCFSSTTAGHVVEFVVLNAVTRKLNFHSAGIIALPSVPACTYLTLLIF